MFVQNTNNKPLKFFKDIEKLHKMLKHNLGF